MNIESPGPKPAIFIHSLWRSSSTYFFDKFRNAPGFFAYQEPLHETVLAAATDAAAFQRLSPPVEAHEALRHPRMEKPYFDELAQTHAAWHDKISKSLIYEDYFGHSGNDGLIAFFESLIRAAPGRPVFQECRTSLRINSLRASVGGVHIALLRNPWDQWWSFKISPYFGAAMQLLLQANGVPGAIDHARNAVGFRVHRSATIAKEIDHFVKHPLDHWQSYCVFFTLWCLAWKHARDNADIVINVDALGCFEDYRRGTVDHLARLGVEGTDFQDFKGYLAPEAKRSMTFCEQVQETVLPWLEADGFCAADFESLALQLEEFARLRSQFNSQEPSKIALEALDRSQEAVLSLEDSRQQLAAYFVSKLDQANATACAKFDRLEAGNGELSEQLQLSRAALARQDESVREFRKASAALISEKDREVATARSIIAELEQLSQAQLEAIDAAQREAEVTRELLRRQSRAHYNSILRATAATDALSADIRALKAQLAQVSAQARTDRLAASAQIGDANASLSDALAWTSHVERSIREPHDRWVEFSATRFGKLVQRLQRLPRLATLEIPDALAQHLHDFRSRGLPNQNEPLRATPMTNITHVDQLLAMNGSAMIDAAYRLILKRSPDREGRAHFNERLADGASKEEILLAFTSSAEARTMPLALEGLDELGARPAAPFWPKQIKDYLHQLDRKINRLDYRLGEQLEAVTRRLGSLEAGFGELRLGFQSGDSSGMASTRGPSLRSVKSGLDFESSDSAEVLLDNLRRAISTTSEANSFQ